MRCIVLTILLLAAASAHAETEDFTTLVDWMTGSFTGGTHDRDCTSSLRGATWASSEIVLKADRIVSWDRGWNDAGEQVWGAEKAGYVFLRIVR